MKKIRCQAGWLISAILLSIQCRLIAEDGHLLAKDGEALYTITLAADAIPPEKTAAEQLQATLKEITGATFPITTEEAGEEPARPTIWVGAGPRVRTLLAEPDWEQLGRDGIRLKSVGEDLILAGGRPRGSLYAVFEFLEKAGGCRWWTETERSIPEQPVFKVARQDLRYAPPFVYREHFSSAMRQDPVFATILRENGHFQKQDAAWGGHEEILGFTHTFSKLLPVEKYFKEHPEWFSDPANGFKLCTATSRMPMRQSTQPCLSNAAVLDEVTRNAIAWLDERPDTRYLSITQNDSSGYCRCAECQAVIDAEGTPGGPLLKFVNAVAARIHDRYPEVLVETLAYNYSEKPPRTIRPADNVLIRFGSPTADVGHPLDSDWNKAARRNLKDWAERSHHLFAWHYVTNFRHLLYPHPNWATLSADLRFFAAQGVTGVFLQGDGYSDGVGDFTQLRTWLLGKLLWNPSQDQDALIGEFLAGYYGPAAPHLRRYLDGLQEAFLTTGKSLATFNTSLEFLTPEALRKLSEAFNAAEQAVAGLSPFELRVKRERLSLDLARLYQYHRLRRSVEPERLALIGVEDPAREMEHWIATAKGFGIRQYSEHDRFEDRIPHLRALFAPPVPLPDFANTWSEGDVIDLQPGVFSLIDRRKYSNLEEDTSASGGVAATIIGQTHQWAIQVPLEQFIADPGRWRVYAVARVGKVETVGNATEAKPDKVAFQCGIYNYAERQEVVSHDIAFSTVADGAYQRLDLGEHELSGGMYIWFAPIYNPAVSKLYVDRLILKRTGE